MSSWLAFPASWRTPCASHHNALNARFLADHLCLTPLGKHWRRGSDISEIDPQGEVNLSDLSILQTLCNIMATAHTRDVRVQVTKIGYYDRNKTPFFACRKDERFSYCLYVPDSIDKGGDVNLVVLIHGTGRTAESLRNLYEFFAEETNSIVLAPLFPVNTEDCDDLHGYKQLLDRGIRYDLILLSMVEEIEQKYGVRFGRFMLHGFSGGAMFAHRFLYLHPEHLSAVSIGAPGIVTLLDSSLPWWVGTQDIDSVFGKQLDVEAIKQVKVQMLIGSDDTETWEIQIDPSSSMWMEGINNTGENRIDRLRALQANFLAHGIGVQFDIVPSVAHDIPPVQPHVHAFFRTVVRKRQ